MYAPAAPYLFHSFLLLPPRSPVPPAHYSSMLHNSRWYPDKWYILFLVYSVRIPIRNVRKTEFRQLQSGPCCKLSATLRGWQYMTSVSQIHRIGRSNNLSICGRYRQNSRRKDIPSQIIYYLETWIKSRIFKDWYSPIKIRSTMTAPMISRL